MLRLNGAMAKTNFDPAQCASLVYSWSRTQGGTTGECWRTYRHIFWTCHVQVAYTCSPWLHFYGFPLHKSSK